MPEVRRTEAITVAIVTATFAVWLVLWAVLIPPFQSPDDIAHLDTAVHVALGDGWAAPGQEHYLSATDTALAESTTVAPADRSTFGELLARAPGEDPIVDQMTQHPPTYYVVAAGVLRAVHFEDLRWDVSLLVLRLLDALIVAPLPLLAWATVRRVTRSPSAALVGACALFATPELASIGSSVTNDAPVILLGGAVTWLGTRVLTGDHRLRTAVGLAVALGLATAVKGTGLPAVPFVALVLLAAPGLPVARRVVRAAGVLLGAAVLGAWPWVHNLIAYGTLQPNGFASHRPERAFPAGTGPDPGTFLATMWQGIARSFWGSFGSRATVAMPQIVIAPVTVLALGVLVVWAFRRGPGFRTAVCLAVFPALLIGGQMLTTAHAYLTTTIAAATQGRYYFPALVAMIALSAVAWRRVPTTIAGRYRLATALVLSAFVVGLVGVTVAATRLTLPLGSAVWASGSGAGTVVVCTALAVTVAGMVTILVRVTGREPVARTLVMAGAARAAG